MNDVGCSFHCRNAYIPVPDMKQLMFGITVAPWACLLGFEEGHLNLDPKQGLFFSSGFFSMARLSHKDVRCVGSRAWGLN